jgi:hypothetical protein
MAIINAPHKTMSLVLVLRFLNIVSAAESAFSVGVDMTLLGPNEIFSGAGAPFFRQAYILVRKWQFWANLSSGRIGGI